MQWQKAKFLKSGVDGELAHLCNREFWVQTRRPKVARAIDRKDRPCQIDDALSTNFLFRNRAVVVSASEVELIGEFTDNPPFIDWDEFVKQ